MKIIIKNIATNYKEEGNGSDVLMLHGWGDNLNTFNDIAFHLSKKHRVIRVDLPGFGKSETPKSAWSLDDYIEFLEEFIEKVNINPEVIIGHSFGGRIVLKGEANNKFNAEKIVLIACAGIAKRNTFKNKVIKIIAKIGKGITLIPPFSFFQDGIKNKFYRKIGSDYATAGELKETFLKVIREDLSSSAVKLKQPTLLIWGEKDSATPLKDGKTLSELIENSKLEIIKGGNHFVHQQNSEKIIKLINDFIN